MKNEKIKELLEDAIVGKAVTEYFTFGLPKILLARVYADNGQGKVLAFCSGCCWQLVYSISNDYNIVLLTNLSGILSLSKEEEDDA